MSQSATFFGFEHEQVHNRACRRFPGNAIIAEMIQAQPSTDGLYRCNGGPLHGEWHNQGTSFDYPGGQYRLLGNEYIWQDAMGFSCPPSSSPPGSSKPD
jgi:hypothetical protein